MEWHYVAYGLLIRSNCSIPSLMPRPAGATPDLDVALGLPLDELERMAPHETVRYTSEELTTDGRPVLVVKQDSEEAPAFWLYEDGLVVVLDPAARRIWLSWPDHLTADDAALCLLGPVLGYVLRLRGTICLHASCVSFEGQAVAFVGPGGAGKSTTAAAFSRQGFPVLTDDVTALDFVDGQVWVRPGYPALRLWPAAVDALYGVPDALPPLTPSVAKCRLGLSEGLAFEVERRPLTRVYFLGERGADPALPALAEVSPREALIALIGNSYRNALLTKTLRAAELYGLTHLVETVPLRLVRAHRDPRRLDALRDLIYADLLAARPAAAPRS